jgi:hypothetical protein
VNIKTPDRAEKDAVAEAWGKSLEEAGCPSFMLIIVQDGRCSVGSTLEGPVMLQVMDTLKESAQHALLLARQLEQKQS